LRPWLEAARLLLALVLTLPLAACVGGAGLTGITEDEKSENAPRRAAFFGGDVIVTGPDGYCVDPGSVQRGGDAGFALIASCAHLGNAPASDVRPAVVTVSVLARDGRAQRPSAARLAAPWANAGVIRQVDRDNVSLIQLERGGDTSLPGGAPRHWRGAMVINGHVIGLAAYGEPGSGVAEKAGQDILVAVAAAMMAASPRRPAPAATEADAPGADTEQSATSSDSEGAPATSRVVTQRRGLKSILSGLFRNQA